MKPELMSHKELLVRARQLESQNLLCVSFMQQLEQLVDNFLPLMEEETDQAIRDFKKAKVPA